MKPRLLEGISFVPTSSGYVVEGTGKRETFDGRVAKLLLGPLLPMLDGRTTTSQLAARLGVSATLIDGVVDVLCEHGLVHFSPPVADPFAVYLRRTLGAECGYEVRDRLARSRVAIVGRNELADLVRRLLLRSGIVSIGVEQADHTIIVRPTSEPTGIAAGGIVGGILRKVGGFEPVLSRHAMSQRESGKHYLTEPRERCRLARSIGQVLRDTPLRGLVGGVRAYLIHPGRSVHYCDSRTLELVRLAGGPFEETRGDQRLLLVLTGDLAGSVAAFGPDARPILEHDTGVVIEALTRRLMPRLVARKTDPRRAGTTDPRLVETLDLDEDREIVTACLRLNGAGRTSLARRL